MTKHIIPAIFLSLLYSGCDQLQGPTGPVGPEGEQGIQGDQGLQGDQGDPGVANIHIEFFSVLSTQWNETDPQTYWYFRDIPEITLAVINFGAVFVQFEVGIGEWWGLPRTVSIDIDDDLEVDFSVERSFIYTVGGLWIYVESSTPILTPAGLSLKAIIIPPV